MTILHLYRALHPRRVKRPTPAAWFWIPYAALVVLLAWSVA